jgi:hypothetical protein
MNGMDLNLETLNFSSLQKIPRGVLLSSEEIDGMMGMLALADPTRADTLGMKPFSYSLSCFFNGQQPNLGPVVHRPPRI